MANKGVERKKSRGSVILNALNAFSAFLYSLFGNGRVGSGLSAHDSCYRASKCCYLLNKSSGKYIRGGFYMEDTIAKSRVLRALGVLKEFFAALSLNVYGVFFVVYSVISVLMYYTSIIMYGYSSHGITALVFSVSMLICSIPMLVTSNSATAVLAESRIMRWFAISVLSIPKEKLNFDKKIGGNEYMFMSAIVAVLFGVLTYFFHPYYLMLIFASVIMICLISSNPETGVVVTVMSVPILQYTSYSKIVLFALVVTTAFSYFSKVARRRRTIDFPAEGVMMILFCGFILVGSMFTSGGWFVFLDSIYTVIMIFAGFFITYNLIRGEKGLRACTKIITISFVCMAFAGIWNLFYNGIGEGFVFSINENIRPIFSSNIIYIADSVPVFCTFAVLSFPLLAVSLTRQGQVKKAMAVIIAILIAAASVFVYGTYEAVIAIAIELLLFWILYDHRSLTVIIIAAIPIIAILLMYPYIASYFDLPNLGELVGKILPLGFENSQLQGEITANTLKMVGESGYMGIGVGDYAFEQAYAPYADEMTMLISEPGSLWLQILCWSGIGGLVMFVLFAVILLKNGIGYMIVSRNKMFRGETVALICAIFVALIFGAVNSLWSDDRMLYLFFVCCGLLAGYVREGRETEMRSRAVFASEFDNADVELRFYN